MAEKLFRQRRLLIRAAALGAKAWLDLAHAAMELAIANRRLASRAARKLLLLAQDDARGDALQVLSDNQRRWVNRVAFATPRMGAHVPWRSDCFVQALAAQSWLRRKGIAAALYIGVRKEENSQSLTHNYSV